jgi:hypothetical protein
MVYSVPHLCDIWGNSGTKWDHKMFKRQPQYDATPLSNGVLYPIIVKYWSSIPFLTLSHISFMQVAPRTSAGGERFARMMPSSCTKVSQSCIFNLFVSSASKWQLNIWLLVLKLIEETSAYVQITPPPPQPTSRMFGNISLNLSHVFTWFVSGWLHLWSIGKRLVHSTDT